MAGGVRGDLPELAAIALTGWALVIAAYDAWRLRVPNLFLVLVAAPALVAQALGSRGLLGATTEGALLGLLIGLLVPLVGYFAGKLGAGDVKYAALIGFLVGAAVGKILLVAALALGVMSLLALAEARLLKRTPRRLPAAVALSIGFLLHLFPEFGHEFHM